jgi:hypothetical protein
LGTRVRLVLTRLMPLIHAIPPVPVIARRGEEHGSGLGVYRCTLVDHLSGLNGPLWCMMGAAENEVASGELSVADCVNVEKGHHGE